MSIKAPRGLFWVALMVVIVGALLLSVGVSSPTEAQTATDLPAPISSLIAVRATFLHADADDSPSQPRVVDLSAADYKPGDTLRISYRVPPGGFSPFGCQGPFMGAEGVRLLGVFSSSNVLLEPSARERVPGAIDAGEDIIVEPTYLNNAPVDIPQDFRVTPEIGVLIEIPPGATHLFLGIADSYYRDNCGTGVTFDIATAPDTTAPSLTVPSNTKVVEATGPDGAVVDFADHVRASDNVDPNPSVDCTPASGSTFTLGTTTVSCTAKDANGNESAAKTFEGNVGYEWSGFLQPINTPANMAPSPYTQSIFKIGSTVPAKFKLTGDSARITDGNFYLKYIRTGNGDGQGETEVAATATGNTGTQFRYDATAGQYIFNWSTKGITTQPGNYEVRVYTDSAFTNLLGSQSIELK